jgi:hypothetical protein
MDRIIDVAMALAPVLVVGSYGYTYAATHGVAKKEDVMALQARIDAIYALLLEMQSGDKK